MMFRLTSLNGGRARTLYEAGVETVAALAAAEPADVENVLRMAGPFSSGRRDGAGGAAGEERSARERKDVRSVWVTGRPAMNEATAARVMVREAQAVLQRDLGLGAGAWGGEEEAPGGGAEKRRTLVRPPWSGS